MRAAKVSAALLLLASAGWAQAGNLFCCTDDRGKQSCGDILPQICIGRAYREINERGVTVRIVEAPLTAEQRAQRDAEEKRRRERDEAEKEQKRQDMALLQTYGSLDDIELMRRRAEADVLLSIKGAEEKIAIARKERVRFENEAEFYKKKELPTEVHKGLKEADYEISAQQNLIEAKKKELDVIKDKYDTDRRRYIEVTRKRARAAQPPQGSQ